MFPASVIDSSSALGLIIAAFGAGSTIGTLFYGWKGHQLSRYWTFMTAMIGIIFLITALSRNILPPIELALLVLVVAGLLVMLMWRWFVRMHYRMQITLIETLNQNKDEQH